MIRWQKVTLNRNTEGWKLETEFINITVYKPVKSCDGTQLRSWHMCCEKLGFWAHDLATENVNIACIRAKSKVINILTKTLAALTIHLDENLNE